MHEWEHVHNSVTRDLSLADESYKMDVWDHAHLEAMALVNSPCSWIKRYL